MVVALTSAVLPTIAVTRRFFVARRGREDSAAGARAVREFLHCVFTSLAQGKEGTERARGDAGGETRAVRVKTTGNSQSESTVDVFFPPDRVKLERRHPAIVAGRSRQLSNGGSSGNSRLDVSLVCIHHARAIPTRRLRCAYIRACGRACRSVSRDRETGIYETCVFRAYTRGGAAEVREWW